MANGNPFFVAPGNNFSQGLSGLSNVLERAGDRRRAREQEEAAAQARDQANVAIGRALRSGDPTVVAEVAVRYPQLADTIYQGMGAIDERQQNQTRDLMRSVVANPGQAVPTLQSYIQDAQAAGRDPSAAARMLQDFQQDPETAMLEAQMAFAGMAGDEWEAMQEQMVQPDPDKLDIVQVYPAEGEPYTAQTDRMGRFFNMAGSPIQMGERDRVVENAQLSGTAKDMDLSSSEMADMRNAEINTINFSNTVNDALSMIEERPDMNTLTARGAALVNDLQTELAAMGNAMGFEVDEAMLDPSSHAQVFDEMGIQNARMRSLVTTLAFARAQANNPDGRISNADVRAAVSEIGGASSDPRAFAQVLQDVRDRSVRNFETMYRIKTGSPYAGELRPQARREVEGVQGQGGGVVDGMTATNPQTGERLILQNGQWVPYDG